jgi:inhibitor of KinA
MMERMIPPQTDIQFFPLGDRAVLVQFARRIDPETNRRVLALSAYLEANSFPGFVESVPSFASVTIHYDPITVLKVKGPGSPFDMVCEQLRHIVANLMIGRPNKPRIVEIPVCYGGEHGPDLSFVADYHHLSTDEVIAIHSQAEYLVYMIGFVPGFPYLGGMPARIATPRRETPRLTIPAGTVGIGGSQTGIYPLATPGGWQCIGRTPCRLFRPHVYPPSLLQAGDLVRFIPITPEEFDAWQVGEP